jgi:uncharacterized protein
MHDELDLTDFRGICRLFPLPDVVLFPHAVVPLHIFEPRYRQMTEHALASDGLVAIVQVRTDADWNGPSAPALEEIACLGKILGHDRLADGRFNFLLLGLRRIRLLREVPAETLYRQANVEVLEDEEYDETSASSRTHLINGFREVASQAGYLDPDLESVLRGPTPLGVLTDLIAHALTLPSPLKQLLLENRKPDCRAEALCDILDRLLGIPEPAHPARPFPPLFSHN